MLTSSARCHRRIEVITTVQPENDAKALTWSFWCEIKLGHNCTIITSMAVCGVVRYALS